MRIPLCGEWKRENKIKDIKIAIVVYTQTFIAASVPFGSHFTAHKLRATNSCAKLSDKPAEITEIRHTTFWNNILPLTSHSSGWRHPVGRRCALRMRHGILFQNISYPNSPLNAPFPQNSPAEKLPIHQGPRNLDSGGKTGRHSREDGSGQA